MHVSPGARNDSIWHFDEKWLTKCPSASTVLLQWWITRAETCDRFMFPSRQPIARLRRQLMCTRLGRALCHPDPALFSPRLSGQNTDFFTNNATLKWPDFMDSDIQYAPFPNSLISSIRPSFFPAPTVTVYVKSSDSFPDPLTPLSYQISLFFFLPLSNFNCPGKVMVGPQGTKNQFIINVTEEGLQEALSSLIWKAVTESVWSPSLSLTHMVCMHASVCVCAESIKTMGEPPHPLFFLTQANLCHHSNHLYLSLQIAKECAQQVSFRDKKD